MPQIKEPLIRTLVKKALKEVTITAGEDNTKFNIKVLVSNPQSETKLGIRIQLTPSDGSFLFTEPDKKGKLEVALMKKMNNSLEQFDIQVSTDTDVSDPEAIGFFIPLSQIKNMIVKSLGIESSEKEKPEGPTSTDDITAPKPKPKPRPKSTSKPKGDIDDLPPKDKGLDDLKEASNNLKTQLNEMRQRELNEISRVVNKDDFYGFVNAGNNVLRTLEEQGMNHINGKKYLKYLVTHNIM